MGRLPAGEDRMKPHIRRDKGIWVCYCNCDLCVEFQHIYTEEGYTPSEALQALFRNNPSSRLGSRTAARPFPMAMNRPGGAL